MYLDIKVFDQIAELSVDIVSMSSTIDEDAEVLGVHGGFGLWHGGRRWSGIGIGIGMGMGLRGVG